MSWPLERTTDSPAATKELAGRVARLSRSGDVVLLVGELGAGKTVFAQGFAAALGVEGPVTSPTFALVRHYRCGSGCAVGSLIHADVYRTGSLAEVADLALAELVEEDAVALVEWGDLAAAALGDERARGDDRRSRPGGRCGTASPDDGGARALGGPGGRGGGGAGARAPWRIVTPAAAAPFPVVAIETATETVGVAVQTPAGVRAEFALTGRRRHVETLTPALEHVLAQVGLVPEDLGAVAVDIGPGLFTGLRVGVATAKALAQSLGIGVVPASSLDILTEGAAACRAPGAGPGLRRRPPGRGVRVRPRARCRRGRRNRADRPRPVRARRPGGRAGRAGRRAGAGGRRRRLSLPQCLRDTAGDGHGGFRPLVPTAVGTSRPGPGAPRDGRIASRAGFRRSPLHA